MEQPAPMESSPTTVQDGLPAELQAKLIQQGAEGRVFKCTFLGKPAIMKERFLKKYRHPILDKKLTVRRLGQEARSILRANRAGVETPCIYFVDTTAHRMYLEFIDGRTVKEFLWNNPPEEAKVPIITRMGEVIAQMHSHDLIHGDLTTSNFMLRDDSQRLVVIDFGLSSQSALPEDKAVDLYVLERAFLSTHPNSETLFEKLLAAYSKTGKEKAKGVIAKLEQVRLRGRKKLAFG